MIPFPSALLASAGAAPPATFLSLDFAAGVYSNGSVTAASIAELPGYAFTRIGEQGAVGADGTVLWFAPNVPAINGAGFHAFGALTNLLKRSQEPGQYPWTSFNGASVTADTAAPAPDGSTTGDRLTVAGGTRSAIYQTVGTIAAGSTNTLSIFVKKPASGAAIAARATYTDAVAAATGPSAKILLSESWQRLVLAAPLNNQGTMLDALIGNPDAAYGFDSDCAGQVDIWQAQVLDGNLPGGGPLIRTASTTAAIGASDLRVGLANGDYSASFTFDDESTQIVALTVSDGLFRHPVKGALARATIKRTIVTAA